MSSLSSRSRNTPELRRTQSLQKAQTASQRSSSGSERRLGTSQDVQPKTPTASLKPLSLLPSARTSVTESSYGELINRTPSVVSGVRTHSSSRGSRSPSNADAPETPTQRSPNGTVRPISDLGTELASPRRSPNGSARAPSNMGSALSGSQRRSPVGSAKSPSPPHEPPPLPASPAALTLQPIASPQRTLDDVRDQVAASTALRAIRKAERATAPDGTVTKLGVILTLSKQEDAKFLTGAASQIERLAGQTEYIFAIATAGAPVQPTRRTSSSSTAESAARTAAAASLLICGSSPTLVNRAVMLACAKFLTRVQELDTSQPGRWLGLVHAPPETISGTGGAPAPSATYDEDALWDVVRKTARAQVNAGRDPYTPPPGSKSIDEVLEAARAKIGRITPTQAYAELLAPPSAEAPPVVLIDIRPAAQRLQHGGVHGSLIIERNVLEWRLDPRCDARLAIADRYDLRAIIFCQEGYTSSLAAAALQELGLWNATDVVGGFKAWKEAGLPTLLLVDDSDAGSEISSVISTDPASRSEIGSYIERTSAVGGSVIGESNARGSTSNGRRSVMTDSVHYYASPEQDQTGSTLSSRHARSESAPKTMSRYSSSERDAPKAPSRYSPSERSAATGQSARRYTGTDHSGTVTPRQTPSDGRSSTPLQVLIEAPSLRTSTRESMTDRGYETAPGGSVVSSSNAEY